MKSRIDILVSIIVANRNGGAFLTECIESIMKEKSLRYELIVVDDGSTDDSMQILHKLNKSHIFTILSYKEGKGLSQARNIGASKSSGTYLFYLDSDATIAPGWVNAIDTFFTNNPKAGCAQAKILRKGKRQFDYAGDFMSPLGFVVDRAQTAEDTGQFDIQQKIFSGKGAAMIIRKDVWEYLGHFDDDFTFYLEDSDFMWRAWIAGYEVWYVPDVLVHHAYGTPHKSLDLYKKNDVDVQRLGCRNMLITHTKNWGIPRLFIVVPFQYLAWSILGVMFFISVQPKKAASVFQGISASIRALPDTMKKRLIVQSKRKISDAELMRIVGIQRGISYYFLKAKSYILGKAF